MTHLSVWPSAMLNGVGTPVAIISQLDTRPACTPVNASRAALWRRRHDSGSGWLARPFLCDSLIHDSTPVYPGALSNLLERHVVDVVLMDVQMSDIDGLEATAFISDQEKSTGKHVSMSIPLAWADLPRLSLC